MITNSAKQVRFQASICDKISAKQITFDKFQTSFKISSTSFK